MSKSDVHIVYDSSVGLMPHIEALTAPPRGSTAPATNAPQGEARRPRFIQNTTREACDFCKEGGDLICCDKCSATYHFDCHDPPLECMPIGEWRCNKCRRRSATPPPPDWSKSQCPDMAHLHTLVSAVRHTNSKEFHLPKDMSCPFLIPGTTKCSSRLSTCVVKRSDQGVVALPGKLCFVCGRSCRVAPLLQCDFCPALYHADCLDPPLTQLPTSDVWMCPNHLEHALDGNMLSSTSLWERVKLWDQFGHGTPVDQRSVQLKFLDTVHRQNQAHRQKKRCRARFPSQIPAAIRHAYAKRTKQRPSSSVAETTDVAPMKLTQVNELPLSVLFSALKSTEENEYLQKASVVDSVPTLEKIAAAAEQVEGKTETESPVSVEATQAAEVVSQLVADASSSVDPTTVGSTAESTDAPMEDSGTDLPMKCEDSKMDTDTIPENTQTESSDQIDSTKTEVSASADDVQHGDEKVDVPPKVNEEASVQMPTELVNGSCTEDLANGPSADVISAGLNNLDHVGVVKSEKKEEEDDDGICHILVPDKGSVVTKEEILEQISAAVKSADLNVLAVMPGAEEFRLVRARALLCPALNLKGPVAPMSYRSFTIGASHEMDLDLSRYAHCNYVSPKHAIIFYDEANEQYELLNYSGFGSYVNNVLFSYDTSDKEDTANGIEQPIAETKRCVSRPAAAVSQVRDLLHKSRVSMNAFSSKKERSCDCDLMDEEEGSDGTKGEAQEVEPGWEGGALLHHGSLLRFGCIEFVFSIVSSDS